MTRFIVTALLALCAIPSFAAIKYWDGNGTTLGAGTAPAGTWSTSAFWSTASDGTATPAVWVGGDDAVFSAGTDATGIFTVTLGSATASSIKVEEGTVTLGGSGAITLGAGTITINSGALLSTDSSVRISTTAGASMTLNGGTVRTTNPGAAGSFVDTDTAIILGTGGGIIDYSVANVLNILSGSSTITGTGPLTKNGVGVIAIATACTYTGPTFINDGEIRIRTTSNRLPTGTDVIVNSPGILNLNTIAQQIGSLQGNGDVGLAGATLTIGGASNTTYTGSIKTTANAGGGGSATTGGSVTKQGAGILTLTGANDFTSLLTMSAGGINVSPGGVLCNSVCDVAVNGGTLSLSNSAQTIENLYGSGGTVALATGHTLTVNAVNAAATRGTHYFGAITGSGNLIKTGTLTERFLGANTYGGTTTVNVGKVVLSTASTGAGSFAIADGAAFGGRVAATGASLAMSDLTVGNTTMEFDFADLGYPTVPVVEDAGLIAVNDTVSVNVRGIDTTGTATLLHHFGARSGGGSFVTGTLPPRASGSVTDDTANNRVTVQINAMDSLVWVSDGAGLWDINDAGNAIWKLASDNTAADYQQNAADGDVVRFDDTATGTTTVNLSTDLSPSKVTVTNTTQNYTFSGLGKFTGLTKLIKSGTGELTITNANELFGGTILDAGTINVANNSALGTVSGQLTINGGVIRSDSATARTLTLPVNLFGNLTLGDPVNSGLVTFSTSPWTVSGTRQITVNDSSVRAVISSAIGGSGGLIKAGDGVLDLTGGNAFTGGFAHNSGTVRVNGNTGLGAANAPVTYADGVVISTSAGTARTLTQAHTLNGNLTFGQAVGGTAAVTLAGSMNLGGTIRTFTLANVADTISAVITNGGVTLNSAGTLTLSGANAYNGDTTVNAGTLSLTGVSTGSGHHQVNPGATLQLNGTATLGNGTGTLKLDGGNLVGSATRSATPLPNPVIMTADTTMPVATTGSGLREFPFAGSFTTTGGTLSIQNTGTANGFWTIRFQNGGLNFTRPIVMGLGSDTGGTRVTAYHTNGSPDQVFSGNISGYGAFYRSAAVTGTGGKTILTADNTYTGGTVVNDGTLLVNNTSGSGTGSGLVGVYSGGLLGGTGTIAGSVVVTNGGAISAGASAGTLTLGAGLDLVNGGTNLWELAANTTSGAGTSFDVLALTGGNVVLGGTSRVLVKFIGTATFPDSTNAFWQQTNTWKIISLSGGAANPGLTVFAGVDGAAGNNAGNFTTSADATGVYLTFKPGVQAPPPVISSTIVGAGTGSAQLSWSSVAGATYKVQYKTNLNQVGWLDLTNLTATGTTTTIADTTSPSPSQRYYRVISP